MRYGHQDSSLRGFSWKHVITSFVSRSSRHRISAFGMEERICLLLPPTCLNPDVQHRAWLPFSVPPSVKRCLGGTGIINPFPIAYAFRPRLRGRLTHEQINFTQETLGFRRTGYSPVLSLLIPAFSLLIPPANLTVRLQRLTERSPTIAINCDPQLRYIV